MKNRQLVLSVLLLVISNVSLAGWEDVRPILQSFQPLQVQEDPIALNGSTINIYYVDLQGDSVLKWTAKELQSRLGELEGVVQPSVGLLHRWNEHPSSSPDNVVIYLGLWQDLSGVFRAGDYAQFHTPPQEEEYYIWVQKHHEYEQSIFVTAMTIRGMNYAVTSLWKAVDQQTVTTSIERAVIVDFPFFPKRQAAVFIHFGGVLWPHPKDPTDQRGLARDLITLGENCLLSNFCGGLTL
jgi:hypothetical protein